MEKYVNSITDNISDKVKKIFSIEYHYDIIDLFESIKNLDEEEKNRVYGETINNLLLKIKDVKDIDNIIYNFYDEGKYEKYMEDLISFFGNDENEMVQSEADIVTIDLINKVLGKNGRTLELPIKTEIIKDYFINSCIKDDNIEFVLMWIIIKLVCIYELIIKLEK